MANFITLEGFEGFRAKIKALPKVIQQEIGAETRFAARNWEGLAKRSAPTDQGRLRNEIRGLMVGPMRAEVVVNVNYAAYVEWGTKRKVKVPGELTAYAAQFRGGRSGAGNAKRMIYAWMNRVGVPKEAQWIVFFRIITEGIRPQPFFFIHKHKVEQDWVKRIKNILNTAH